MPDPQEAALLHAPASEMTCPNCLHRGLSSFYEAANVPVHSVLLMATREQALGYRRGQIELMLCTHCGFVANGRFDASAHEYSPRYEETQGFSPTFNRFAEGLAQRVVERYGLRGKTILEIGCGKGEFLNLLCRLGDNRGIGVDPAYVPERGDPALVGQVEFIQDFYGEKYAHLAADFVCCRHTLEHIGPTHEFLRQLRRTLDTRPETLVFFELPDTYRVLREGAFWDVYYEHCSYFTAGSLARLFRKTGFEVLDLDRDYDDQYLLITARPTTAAASVASKLENDGEAVRQAVAEFPGLVARRKRRWRSLLDDAVARDERVVIWGSGSKGVAFLHGLGVRDEIEYAVDINPYRQGKFMPGTGQEIIAPERLAALQPAQVIVMNPIYRDEIRRDLERLHVAAELHTI